MDQCRLTLAAERASVVELAGAALLEVVAFACGCQGFRGNHVFQLIAISWWQQRLPGGAGQSSGSSYLKQFICLFGLDVSQAASVLDIGGSAIILKRLPVTIADNHRLLPVWIRSRHS